MAVAVLYLGTSFPDTWLDTKTPAEIKAWLEDFARQQGKSVTAWVCPLMDGHIAFGGGEPDWRARHSG